MYRDEMTISRMRRIFSVKRSIVISLRDTLYLYTIASVCSIFHEATCKRILTIFFFHFSGVNVLKATEITEQIVGVRSIRGRCDNDKAYQLNERAILTVQTSQLFPDSEQFPLDFSILTDIRIDKGSETVLRCYIINQIKKVYETKSKNI